MKTCILVDYKSGDGNDTYELFTNIEKAFKFADDKFVNCIRLVKANNTYYEDGDLNYEDLHNTIMEVI
jgi:hypothetical protein